jgi:hypothetical protein
MAFGGTNYINIAKNMYRTYSVTLECGLSEGDCERLHVHRLGWSGRTWGNGVHNILKKIIKCFVRIYKVERNKISAVANSKWPMFISFNT